MKMYCPDCGAKIEYTSNKPNFCINCGHAFGNIKASQNVQEADDDDLENDQINPEMYDGMQTLDVEISGGRNKGQKLGDLVGALPEDHKVEQSPKLRSSKKKILEEWAKEAGAKSKPKKRGRPPKKK